MKLILFILVFSLAIAEAKPVVKAKKSKKRSTALLQWITPGWVDTSRDPASKDGFTGGALTASPLKPTLSTKPTLLIPKNSSGGSGSTSQSPSAPTGESLVFDDNAAKGGVGKAPEPKVGGRGGKPPSGDGSGDGGGGTAFAKWYPLCLFIDASEGDVNNTVKGVVDMAAGCGVNLVVWPITVKSNYPNSSSTINKMAQNACNIVSAGISQKASVSTCVRFADTAGEMCGDPPEKRPSTAGCAQLGSGSGSDKGMIARMQGSGHFGGQSEEGQAVPSIERAGACTPSIVAHESQGHSQFGWPNGSAAGNGIGTPDEGNAGGGASGGGGEGWTGIGCAQMRSTALANDGRWKYNPKQTVYYVPQTDPQRQWDLTDPKQKLFPEPKGDPPSEPPSTPPRIGDRKNQMNDDFFKTPPGEEGDEADGAQVSSLDEKHKRQPGSALDALMDGVKSTPKSIGRQGDPDKPKAPDIPPSSSGEGDGSGLVFNDTVSKSDSAVGGITRDPATSSGSYNGDGSEEGSEGLTFDDSVKKGSVEAGTSNRRGNGAGMSQAGMGLSLGGMKRDTSMDDEFWAKLIKARQERDAKRVKGSTLRTAKPVRSGTPAAKIYSSSSTSDFSSSSDD